MIQFESYSPIPQEVKEVTDNKIKLLDEYILFQSGEFEYTALIHDLITDETRQLTFSRAPEELIYAVHETDGLWTFTVSNEVYCYSNVGLGAALDLPVIDGIQGYYSVLVSVVLIFLVVFKSTLFPFHKKK